MAPKKLRTNDHPDQVINEISKFKLNININFNINKNSELSSKMFGI